MIHYLISRLDTAKKPKKNRVAEMITNARGLLTLATKLELPSLISKPEKDVSKWIVLKNGVLDTDLYLKSGELSLMPHSPDLFTLSALPFDLDKSGRCPIWNEFLRTALPDNQVRDLLQEWFGYNLVLPTGSIAQFQKFLILVGEGANGKSVICLVLRLLLGEKNVSAVPLEAFDQKRTFALASMIGKLANVVEEIGEIDKAAEGLLKDLVSGGVVSVERKYQHPFAMVPTARLTFATNTLPRFTDRSQGLWRRLLVIPFKNQVLDPERQNANLVSPDWWLNSGELSGIFLWALEGLKRLRENGKFTECPTTDTAKQEFRQATNPHRSYLNDTVREDKAGVVATATLYRLYSESIKKGGHNALSSSAFAQEVKRTFPSAATSEHPQRQSGGWRSRNWHGITFIDPDAIIQEWP